MRPEVLYLTDVVEAADAIRRFLVEVPRETFLNDEVLQSAVLQKLIVIGEAAARLSSDFRADHRGVPWADVVGFRNIAVHEYFAVSWPHCLGDGDPRCALAARGCRGNLGR
jgi:uncharacterized protein with HEPN domain